MHHQPKLTCSLTALKHQKSVTLTLDANKKVIGRTGVHQSISQSVKQKYLAWRELEAIRYSLESTKQTLKSKTIFWYIPNYTTSVTVKKVATKHIYTVQQYICLTLALQTVYI